MPFCATMAAMAPLDGHPAASGQTAGAIDSAIGSLERRGRL